MVSNLSRTGVAYVVGHYFMTSVGYFGLLSSLVVILNAQSFSAAQIAVLMSAFTLTNKVAKIPLAPWLDRFSPARSVLLGCGIAALGLGGLYARHDLAVTAAVLMFASVGISINALASKQLAAAASDNAKNRAKMFSIVNIAVNVSSAIAAPLALMLVDRRLYPVVTCGAAAIYLLAGIVTSLNFSRMDSGHRGAGAMPSLRTYLRVFGLPGMRPFLVVNFFGWFLYGQLFNALALHVSRTLASPAKLGWLYTLNALMVVVLQLGVTHLSERTHGGRPLKAMQISYAIYMAAFIAPFFVPSYAGAIVLVILFTLAEMIFVPRVDVLLLGLIGQESRAVSYSVLSISTALGESCGGGLGLIGYRWMSNQGRPDLFWLLAAVLALLFALATRRMTSTSGGFRASALAPALS